MNWVTVYQSDFGIVELGRAGNPFEHDLLKRPVGLGRKRRTCKRKCQECRLRAEAAFNTFLEAVWLKGGLVKRIHITTPAVSRCD